jgi:glycosyltransferase involved in cell wall biosynthesis
VNTVSVVVPCYNYGHLLEKCVASVLSQEGVDVEVLIIDDCSTDDSFAVAASLAAVEPRVEARRHDVNMRHIATYNEGLAWARGEFTVLLSADDLLTPGALARAVALFERHPEVGLVYGRSIKFESEESLPVARVDVSGWIVWDDQKWFQLRCHDPHNVISCPEVVVRTELQKRLGGYRADLPNVADLEMWMRFAVHSDVGYIVGADQAYYRVHPSSMQRTYFVDPLTVHAEYARMFEGFFAQYGEVIAHRGAIEAAPFRAIAKEILWRASRALDGGAAPARIDDFIALAVRYYAQAVTLPEYRALQRRLRVSPALRHLFLPATLVTGLRWRVRDRLWQWSWARHGVGTVRSGGRRLPAVPASDCVASAR